MKIYKYPIYIGEMHSFEMPEDAEIISFQSQHNIPCIWAIVDPERPAQERHFMMVGTGHEFNINQIRKFIGTCQTQGGACIWHLFEMSPPK